MIMYKKERKKKSYVKPGLCGVTSDVYLSSECMIGTVLYILCAVCPFL